jgi:hypothetical protein
MFDAADALSARRLALREACGLTQIELADNPTM